MGSYVNPSGLSEDGAVVVRVPSPSIVFALPPLARKYVSVCAPRGGHVSDVCHLLRPIV